MANETERDAFAAVLALKAFPELAQVHPDDLVALAARASERHYGAGERIAAGREGAAAVLFLLEGRVREPDRSATHEAPALLGVPAALADGDGPVFVAETDVDALELGRAEWLDLLEDEFELWLATLRVVCRGGALALAPEPAAADLQDAGALGDLADRLLRLRRIAPFRALPICLLGEIAAEMQPRVVASGEVLWEADEPATHALWIVAGRADVEEAAGRSERPLRAGALVGLSETLAAASYGFRLRARGPLEALELDGEALIDALEDDATGAVELLCALARHSLRSMDDRGGPR